MDLPMPGSPPRRTTEPSTRPPPRARSNPVQPQGRLSSCTEDRLIKGVGGWRPVRPEPGFGGRRVPGSAPLPGKNSRPRIPGICPAICRSGSHISGRQKGFEGIWRSFRDAGLTVLEERTRVRFFEKAKVKNLPYSYKISYPFLQASFTSRRRANFSPARIS